MKNFFILTDAVNYIEDNLCENITQEDIAKNSYCSVSSLQKLFKYAFHISIKEYISKRRLTHAAKELVETENNIIDIGMKYQYNSPEVFTRAFSKVWGVTPSKFRNEKKFTGLYPKIDFDYKGGNLIVSRKKFDISQLYDELKKRTNTYVLSFDISNFAQINEISYEAGDMTIVECLKRIDENSSDDMLLFRIGGDEFALVTGLSDIEEAKKVANKILALNNTPLDYNNKKIPVSMRVGGIKINNKTIKYADLYSDLSYIIDKARHEKVECYFVE